MIKAIDAVQAENAALRAKLTQVEQIVAERERLRAIAEYRRKRIRNTELVALNMTDAFTEQHDRAEKAESALSTALEEMERLARENYNLADRIQSGGIRIQLLTDQLATAEQDRDRLAAEVEQVKDVGAAFKQANEEMHEMIMQIRRRFKAWDIPYSPVGQDIVDCIIRHADEELTAAQEENKRLEEQNADLLAALQIVKEQRQLWWGKAVHLGRELSAAQQSAQVEWLDGEPPFPWCDEWFIAVTAYGDKVVLTALPKEHTYDYKTADNTYFKADKIAKWAQFPDSEYIPYSQQSAQEQYRKGLERAAEICLAQENGDKHFYVASKCARLIRAELSKGEGNEPKMCCRVPLMCNGDRAGQCPIDCPNNKHF